MFTRLQLLVLTTVMVLYPLCVSAQTVLPPLLLLSQWEQQMVQYGTMHCQHLQGSSMSGDQKLAATYYDAERVFYLIADYTRDSRWLDCARAAEQVYRDGYLLANDGKLPGYWVFGHGLWRDFKQTQDPSSRDALILMGKNAAYSFDGTPLGDLSAVSFSREVAYNLQAKILSKDTGTTQFDASITRLAQEAFNHMDAWFVTNTAPFMQPFMVGLTSEALIMYYNLTGDGRVLPAISRAMEFLWNHLWVASAQAFLYIDKDIASEGGASAIKAAPDLNLLIAPAFAWLYHMTGDRKWIDRGDLIWVGGVINAFLDNGKQFNQSYRWSFDYLVWRNKIGQPFVVLNSTQTPGSSGSTGGSTGASGSTSSNSGSVAASPSTPGADVPGGNNIRSKRSLR